MKGVALLFVPLLRVDGEDAQVHAGDLRGVAPGRIEEDLERSGQANPALSRRRHRSHG